MTEQDAAHWWLMGRGEPCVRPFMETGFLKRLKRAITRIAPTIRVTTADFGAEQDL